MMFSLSLPCLHHASLISWAIPIHPDTVLFLCFFLSVIRAKISGEKIVSPSNSSSPYMKMIQYEIKMIKVRPLGSRNSRGWGVIFSSLFSYLFVMRLLTGLSG